MRRYAHNFCIVCVACVWNAGVKDIRRTDRQTDNKLVVVMRIAGGFIVNPQRICIVASSLRISKECRNRQWLSRVCVRDRLKQFVLIPQESGRLRPRVEARKPHAKAMLPKPARQNNSSWPLHLGLSRHVFLFSLSTHTHLPTHKPLVSYPLPTP